MRLKQIVGLALVSVTFVVVIASMATLGWFKVNGTNTTTYYGLRKYQVVGTGGSVEGSISDLPDSDARSRLIKGGNEILGTGIVALIFLAASIILGLIALAKPNSRLLQLSLASDLVATILILVGVVLYAQEFNIGYSFIIFLASGFICALASSLFIVAFAYVLNKRRIRIAGLLLFLLAYVMTIIAMGTHGWIYTDTTVGSTRTVYSTGLVKSFTTVYYGSSTVESSADLTGNDATGGKDVLGCGVPALVVGCATIAMIMLSILRDGRYSLLSVVGTTITGSLIILGTVLYAETQYIYYSYILFIVTGFIGFTAAFIMAAGFLENKSTESTESSDAPKKTQDK